MPAALGSVDAGGVATEAARLGPVDAGGVAAEAALPDNDVTRGLVAEVAPVGVSGDSSGLADAEAAEVDAAVPLRAARTGFELDDDVGAEESFPMAASSADSQACSETL